MSYAGDGGPIESLRDEQGLFYGTIKEATRLMEGMPKGSFLVVTSQVSVDLNCPEGTSLTLSSHKPERVVDLNVVFEDDGSVGMVRQFIYDEPLDVVRLRAKINAEGLELIQMQGEPIDGVAYSFNIHKNMEGLRGISLVPNLVGLHEV